MRERIFARRWLKETESMRAWRRGSRKVHEHYETMRLWDDGKWDDDTMRLWDYDITKLWQYESMRGWDYQTIELWDYASMRVWEYEIYPFVGFKSGRIEVEIGAFQFRPNFALRFGARLGLLFSSLAAEDGIESVMASCWGRFWVCSIRVLWCGVF